MEETISNSANISQIIIDTINTLLSTLFSSIDNSVYDFLDKLITVALPRVKDFRGLSKSKFDGRGNYAFGIKEHLIFPEISVDKIDAIRGMDIVIATTAKTDDEARALLTKIGLPLVLK